MKRKIFSVAAVAIMATAGLITATNSAFAENFISLHELDPGGFRENILPFSPVTERTALHIPVPNTINENYRIFLPPGTYDASMVYYSAIGALSGTVARAGQPPANDYPDLNSGNFYTLPWENRDNCLWENIKSRDLYTMVSGGIGTVLYDSFPMLTEGAWVYVRPLTVNCSLYHAATSISVVTEPFLEWYNARKDNDACWDAKGNPIECGGTKAAISGRVTTMITGQVTGVSGAAVYLVNQEDTSSRVASGTTNASGNYQFTDVAPGSYFIRMDASDANTNDIMPFDMHKIDDANRSLDNVQAGEARIMNIELGVPDLTDDLAKLTADLEEAKELCKTCENDANRDGLINLGDVIYILQVLTGIRPAI